MSRLGGRGRASSWAGMQLGGHGRLGARGIPPNSKFKTTPAQPPAHLAGALAGLVLEGARQAGREAVVAGALGKVAGGGQLAVGQRLGARHLAVGAHWALDAAELARGILVGAGRADVAHLQVGG